MLLLLAGVTMPASSPPLRTAIFLQVRRVLFAFLKGQQVSSTICFGESFDRTDASYSPTLP